MPAEPSDREPRPEDFGITASDLERVPQPMTARCRSWLVAGLWLVALVVAFGVILHATGSLPAAAVFSVIGVAAASVVLVPLLLCVVCASERAETRWLCRHVPVVEACLAYRAATEAYRRRARPDAEAALDHGRWLGLTGVAFRAKVAQELERGGFTVTAIADREAAGHDFLLDDPRHGRVLVRCEAGGEPVPVGVGRELVACLGETGADRAVLVTAGTPSSQLEAYLGRHPLEMVAPWALTRLQSAAD